jgi:hypothetical protein
MRIAAEEADDEQIRMLAQVVKNGLDASPSDRSTFDVVLDTIRQVRLIEVEVMRHVPAARSLSTLNSTVSHEVAVVLHGLVVHLEA